jgi:hypothetical protein
MRSLASDEELGIGWSDPVPLTEAIRGAPVPAVPGLYRIRRIGMKSWDYIGQTGSGQMNLRRRMAMLRGIYLDAMPYRDPHTAGPALWALLQSTDTSFEASICPVVGDTPWRKALEAVAVARHRQRYGRSPTANFGRMPPGYRMSSGNNARLVAAGKRLRGGVCAEPTDAQLPGQPPLGPLDADTRSARWCGHIWSAWLTLTAETIAAVEPHDGLYRILGREGIIMYVGEGRLRTRLATHAAKLATSSAQAQTFREAAPLRFSAVTGQWLRHQRLELETDLIAACVLADRRPPPAQFIG